MNEGKEIVVGVAQISAKEGTNMEVLQELIIRQGKKYLTAEKRKFFFYPHFSDFSYSLAPLTERPEGTIIESWKSRAGMLLLAIVQRGVVKKGDCIVIGQKKGTIRSIKIGDKEVEEAYPKDPVTILGYPDLPLPTEGNPTLSLFLTPY